MTRPDRYDVMGLAVLALLVALWVAHFVLPAPPPDPSREIGALPQAIPVMPVR
jgi:hypothetical protein